MKNNFSKIVLSSILIIGIIAFSSCQKDKEDKRDNKNIEIAKSDLSGDFVFTTHVKMNGNDLTLLPAGMPTLCKFKSSGDTLMFTMIPSTIGNMPYKVSVFANLFPKSFNTWEKKEYNQDWVQFACDNGYVAALSASSQISSHKGGSAKIRIYYNIKTKEVEFSVDFNIMNVLANAPKQKINNYNIDDYDSLLETYTKELKKYKEEHGL